MTESRLAAAERCEELLVSLRQEESRLYTELDSPERQDDLAYVHKQIHILEVRQNIHHASARALLCVAMNKYENRLKYEQIKILKHSWFKGIAGLF